MNSANDYYLALFQLVSALLGIKVFLFLSLLVVFAIYIKKLSKELAAMNLPGWRKDYPDLSMMEKIDAGNANWRWSQRHIIYLFTADENTSVRLVRLRRNALVSFCCVILALAFIFIDLGIMMFILRNT